MTNKDCSKGYASWENAAPLLPPLGDGLHIGLELEMGWTRNSKRFETTEALIAHMDALPGFREFGLFKAECPGIEYVTRPATLAEHAKFWSKASPALRELPVYTGLGIGGHTHVKLYDDDSELTIAKRLGWLMNRYDTMHIVSALTRPPGTGGYNPPYLGDNKAVTRKLVVIGGRDSGNPVVMGRYNTFEFRCFPASFARSTSMAYLEMTELAWKYAHDTTDPEKLNVYDMIAPMAEEYANGNDHTKYSHLARHFSINVIQALLPKFNDYDGMYYAKKGSVITATPERAAAARSVST